MAWGCDARGEVQAARGAADGFADDARVVRGDVDLDQDPGAAALWAAQGRGDR